jgi:hypothetical protein
MQDCLSYHLQVVREELQVLRMRKTLVAQSLWLQLLPRNRGQCSGGSAAAQLHAG